MIGYRHCDARYPFLWSDAAQPSARWHADGEGPANYFADTPVGAWAEFLRHEEITDSADLLGVRRALWAVELPDDGYASPALPPLELTGGLASYAACQAEAQRLRATGETQLAAPSAALLPGGARGWICSPGEAQAPTSREGRVFVLFGPSPTIVGWPAVEAGAPSARILAFVRPLR